MTSRTQKELNGKYLNVCRKRERERLREREREREDE